MTVTSGSNAVSNGLILNFDSGNRRSMAGAGTERIGGISASFSNWAGLTGTSVNYTSASGVTGVYLNTIVGGGVNWWNSNNGQVACSSSTPYIISAKVKYVGSSTTPNQNLFYVRQYNSSGQTSESGKFTSSNMIPIGGDWYLAWAQFTTDSNATSFLVQGYEYSGGMNILLEDVQCKLYGLGDLSSTGSNVSISNGTPSLTTLGGALCHRFTSTSQRLTGTLNTTPPVTNLSIEIWVYPESEVQGDDRGCMFWLGGSSSVYMSWNKGNQQLSNYWYSHPTEGYWETGASVSRNRWNSFTSVWNNSTGYLYQWTNGVKTTSTSTATGNASTGTTIQIGNEGGSSRQFAGGIGLIRVYNVALTDAQVSQNYASTRGRFGI